VAISTYLVNKVTSYLDFIFAIACFLLELTKPHCSRFIISFRTPQIGAAKVAIAFICVVKSLKAGLNPIDMGILFDF
jgi:hypothetical protein